MLSQHFTLKLFFPDRVWNTFQLDRVILNLRWFLHSCPHLRKHKRNTLTARRTGNQEQKPKTLISEVDADSGSSGPISRALTVMTPRGGKWQTKNSLWLILRFFLLSWFIVHVLLPHPIGEYRLECFPDIWNHKGQGGLNVLIVPGRNFPSFKINLKFYLKWYFPGLQLRGGWRGHEAAH